MISIIIPVYNNQDYLDKCIESVLQQTYPCDEIILIDDGSTDQSGQLCDQYCCNYSHIVCLHNDNYGPAYSRKCGLEASHGDLIMFLDSDDWIEDNTLEVLYHEMFLAEADVVTCEFIDIYNNGKKVPHNVNQEHHIDCISYEECIHEIHGTRRLLTGPVAKLYRRDLFRGVDFKEHITIGEDYTMLLQVLQNAKKVRILNRILYNRRMHGDNISRSGYTERHRKALDNYLEIRKTLCLEFPQLYIEILGYHIEYEMAVITAMCRNNVYDQKVIRELKMDLRSNLTVILHKCSMPLYMKISSVLIASWPPLFCLLFKTIRISSKR